MPAKAVRIVPRVCMRAVRERKTTARGGSPAGVAGASAAGIGRTSAE